MKYLSHVFFGKNTGKIFVLVVSLALILLALSVRPNTTKTKQFLSSNPSTKLSSNPVNHIAQAKNTEQEKKLLQQSPPTLSTNFDLPTWISGVFNSENNTNSSMRPIIKNNTLNDNYNINHETNLFPEIAKENNNYKIDLSRPNFEISQTTEYNTTFQAKIEWQPLVPQTIFSDKVTIGSELKLQNLDKNLNVKITDWRILDPETLIIVSRDIFEKLGGNPENQKYLTIQITKI